MRAELITFDCYGTLIDWNAGLATAFREEAARLGEAFDAAEALAAYHQIEPEVQATNYRPYRDVLADVGRGVAQRLGWSLPEGDTDFIAESLPSWPPFPETNGVLERLNADGCRLGILSNIDDDLLAETLRHFTVAFDLLVTAEQLRSYKPASAHFHRALDEVEGDRGRIVHIAASYFHDVRPARELGIRTVWINREGERRPAGGPAPTVTATDLDGAVRWLETDRT